MDLRQKVLFASQEDKSTLQYDTRLVQDTFFQTLMTGLEESVRIHLQPDLEDPNTSDEVLLEKLTVAVARNQVRQKKRPGKPAHVKPVAILASEPSPEKPKEKKDKDKPNSLRVELDSLKEQMHEIKQLLKDGRRSQQGRPRRPDSEWGCTSCQRKGLGRQCHHCFKCGGEGHRARECSNSSNQGNEEGLPHRGTE
ncbi:hypothetical protein HOLleu_14217 [Holothuria leucospilota]|uniref:CCHC-type domain-containing protein n=1 Tax=Holothuria leucospilota TaxID=206669 RepID=A0A9Q1H8S9_HOLLE|nr:hypothetical protein HOLleu_14217 [Holothuria leucospilota]